MTEPIKLRREAEVLIRMADGMSNAEIAGELFITEDTVKTHARRLFRKLGARDRTHAVSIAYRLGILLSSPPAAAADAAEPLWELRRRLDETDVRRRLAKWRPVRDEAPDNSRFARLYDDIAAALGEHRRRKPR